MGIYKECDIRGVYNKELDENTAYDIGRAIGTKMSGKSLVVAGDVRVSTNSLKSGLIDGLYRSGANIIDIGMAPTPVLYFAKNFYGADGGIAVTASHNPPQYNGFKFILGEWPVTPEDIGEIKGLVGRKQFINGEGSLKKIDASENYRKFIKSLTKRYKRLKVVIDAGNGATSVLAPRIFRELGYEVVELFCEFDGSFPNRSPNPAVYGHLKTLQEIVVAEKADLGAAFDGDGDRVVFVDDKGNVSTSEESFTLFIKEYLKEAPGPVVYDVKSSSIVEREIKKHNSRPIMERSGHAFIKRTLLESGAVLAGEISGHFFFKELGGDDGIYAAVKMAEILGKNGISLSEHAGAVAKTIITPDIRVPCASEMQEALLAKIAGMSESYPVSRLDGVRVEFPNGWLLVRKSVTEPCVTVRIEADGLNEMDGILNVLYEYAPELKGKHEFLK